jgi:DnaJ like chaperone protein
MGWFGKLTFGYMGLLMGGPLGAIAGAALGHHLSRRGAESGGLFCQHVFNSGQTCKDRRCG